MLRRRDIIGRGKRPRSAHRRIIIAAAEPFDCRIVLQAHHRTAGAGRRASRSPENSGSAAFNARSAAHQLSATTAIQPSRAATCRTPGMRCDRVASNSSVSRPPGGAIRTDANSIPGSRTSPAKRQLPSTLAGPSSRCSGWPISRPLLACRSGALRAACGPRPPRQARRR